MADQRETNPKSTLLSSAEFLNCLKPEIDIRPYEGQAKAGFKIGDLERTGRVDQVEPELWIVGNDPECFNDIEFIEITAGKMAELLKPYKADCLFAPATRAMFTAFKTAELLGHRQI